LKRVIAAAALAFTLLGTSAAQASTIHTVVPGDTLSAIAVQHQVPDNVIRRTNGLSSDRINAGAFLRIPETYVVKSGDTLWQISQRNSLPLATIRSINNASDALRVGQVLYLPTTLRNVVNLSPADLDLFARLVSAEAKGEPLNGQAAVASVVLNRVKSPDFPNTVRGVIMEYSGSVPAFSPVANGQIDQPALAPAKEAVRTALLGYDNSLGADYFYNPALTGSGNWIRTRSVTTTIGNHRFAR
jgi:N-acetylmuramoyl-L-alanine amidase